MLFCCLGEVGQIEGNVYGITSGEGKKRRIMPA